MNSLRADTAQPHSQTPRSSTGPRTAPTTTSRAANEQNQPFLTRSAPKPTADSSAADRPPVSQNGA
jgi:hypothetical protein